MTSADKMKWRIGMVGILAVEVLVAWFFFGVPDPLFLLIGAVVGGFAAYVLGRKASDAGWDGWGSQLLSFLLAGVIGLVVYNVTKGGTGRPLRTQRSRASSDYGPRHWGG